MEGLRHHVCSYSITVATDGSTCSNFVQEFPFYAFYKVAILTPKAQYKIPTDALYFIAYQISRERWRYVYARKFGKGRLSETSVFAPFKSGKPDFAKMAEVMRSCAAYPFIASFRSAYDQYAKAQFADLAREWRKGRKLTSSVGKMIAHPAYRAIISLGAAVVPYILKDLAVEPDHWFIAPHAITGADPVEEKERGILPAMAKAWLRWGKEEKYI